MKHYSISVTGKLMLFLLSYCLFTKKTIAQTPDANNFSSYVSYNGTYRYGANPGYYGSNWNAENIATLAMGNTSLGVKGTGVKSLRVPLYDDFLTTWGLTTELSKFQAYANMGGGDFTAFIGSPAPAHREPTTFPGSPEQAKTFKGIYEPIWLDAAQTQVNPNNTYAQYLYNVVKTYGQYIKFWEVVNEPDFTYSPAGWSGDTNPPTPGSWYDHNPTPAELENLRAPIFYYIRTLRVSWEIIKKLSPSSYVCTGGIGYRDFLDAILRNTDNPVDGSVTSAYPSKGGAYFDVLSFHCYPMYNIPKTWDNTTASVVQIRHSDAATDAYINVKKTMNTVLASYGYNNSQYPQKQFICTETGASRIMSGADWGGNEGQKNYMIKAQVASQKADIKQVYWFQVGDGPNTSAQFDQMGLYTYFGNTSPYYNITKSDQGIALKTTTDQLYGRTYDAARTSALALPSGVDGGAFRGVDGSYVYVLWARTQVDLSETASATYSFPAGLFLSSTVDRKEWNYSETNASTSISKSGIALTGSPSFFTESGSSAIAVPTTPSTTGSTIRIQAENWTAMSGVATENAWGDPTGGGLDVGWIDPNDWMDYSFNAPVAGTYTVNFRIASAANGAQFQLKKSDGTVLTTVNVPNTGGWQTWQTISATVTLAAGQQTIRLFSTSTPGTVFNVNWLEFVSSGTATTTPVPTSSTTRIQAENYLGMNGVNTENAWGDPTGGGLDVGWIDPNDWMDYGFNAPVAGTYTVNFRIASAANGAQFQLKKSDGTVLTTVNVPNTGGWQTWQTISATVTLAAGQQTIRLFCTSTAGSVFNINWLEFVSGSSLTATAQRSTSIMSTDTTATTSAALDVVPNPVIDRFALQVNNNLTGTMTVQIVDMQGALQKQFSLSKTATGSSQFYLSIGDLAAGNYVVKATMTNWTQTKQIIKQ